MYIIILLVYSIGHFIIDLTTGLAHYGQNEFYYSGFGWSVGQTFMYNTLAFGIQPFLGYLIDRWNISRFAAILGCLLAGSSLLLLPNPSLSIVFAGIGNALYHLGAGVSVWRLFPRKAWALGVLVGPGALGITWSRTLGADVGYYMSPVITVLMFLTMMIIFLPNLEKIKRIYEPLKIPRGAMPIILLLLISTMIRSYIGMNLNFPWKTGANMALFLVLAIASGKMLGGFAADHFGRIKASAIALVLAAPLIAWGTSVPISGIFGTFLFQSTMAVTLLGLFLELPENPAFAFGLLCFALWVGMFFTQVVPVKLPHPAIYCIVIILTSCAALCSGLWLQLKKEHSRNE